MSRPSLSGSRLAVVALLVGLQGAALVALAIFYVVELAVATAADIGRALVTATLAVIAGVALLAVARGLRRGRRWARSPALVTNLILVPVAVGLFQGGRWYVGAPLLAWGATVVVLLFSRALNDALEETETRDRPGPPDQR